MFRFLSIFISSIVRRWVFIVFGNRAQMFLLFPHSRIISARTRWYAARQLSTQSQFSGNVGTGRTINWAAAGPSTWHGARGTCPGQHPSNWIILLTPARPHVYIYQLDKLSSAQTRARTEHPISQATPARWSLTPDCWLYYVSWCPHLPRVSCPRGHWSLPLDQNELGSGRLELYIWVSWVQNQIVVIYGGAWPSPAQPSPAQPCHPPRTFSVPAWQPPRSHHSQ